MVGGRDRRSACGPHNRGGRAFSARQQGARVRAARAKALVQEGWSLRAASREAGTTPRTVKRVFGRALERQPNGRYVAHGDREPFVMRIISDDVVVERVVRGDRRRSIVGRHHNAVAKALGPDGGNPAVLAPFVHRRVAGVQLGADLDRLAELWRQGELDFLEIYVIGR
jgi:AraC-like DNA-binding protein